MRVLTVVTDLDKGGVQRTAQNFAEEYAALGHDSRVLAMHELGPRADALRRVGIPIFAGYDDEVAATIRAWAPEVVHLHAHRLSSAAVHRLLDDNPAAVAIEKNVFSIPSPWEGRLRASHQMSSWCLWLYGQRCRARTARPMLVPNPINEQRFYRVPATEADEFRRHLGIPPEARVLGRIGQAHLSKWSLLLIDLFEDLARADGRVYLLVVNPPPQVDKACRESAFAKRIRRIDRIEGDQGLRVAYSAMDVFVHVAEGGESFGNVLLESQLCETPVVTFSTPWADNSQTEVVANGVGGVVVTTRRGLYRSTAWLLTDPDARQAIAVAGRATVLSRYARRPVAEAALATATAPAVTDTRDVTLHDIQRLYRRAWDRPSRLATVLLRGKRLRLLIKYVSGFKPWSHLLSRIWVLPMRRLRKVAGRCGSDEDGR